jgi:hypothetical protein
MQPAGFGATVVTDRPSEVAAFYTRYLDLQVGIDLGWFITLRRGTANRSRRCSASDVSSSATPPAPGST